MRLKTDYLMHRAELNLLAQKIVYTGPIDAYFDYQLGNLEYRGLGFETEHLEEENHQGVAVVNHTEKEVPYARIIEHKFFEFGRRPITFITKEYPVNWQQGDEAYYQINDAANQTLYDAYARREVKEDGVFFGGSLAEYKYYDMDKVIENALNMA